MLKKVFEIHHEIYKYSHSAYRQPSFLFYGDSVIKSCEWTQQGDPESPALFSDSNQGGGRLDRMNLREFAICH